MSSALKSCAEDSTGQLEQAVLSSSRLLRRRMRSLCATSVTRSSKHMEGVGILSKSSLYVGAHGVGRSSFPVCCLCCGNSSSFRSLDYNSAFWGFQKQLGRIRNKLWFFPISFYHWTLDFEFIFLLKRISDFCTSNNERGWARSRMDTDCTPPQRKNNSISVALWARRQWTECRYWTWNRTPPTSADFHKLVFEKTNGWLFGSQ